MEFREAHKRVRLQGGGKGIPLRRGRSGNLVFHKEGVATGLELGVRPGLIKGRGA